MSKPSKPAQVIARYSALKTGGWVAVASWVCVWTLQDGAANGWRPPEGQYALLYPGVLLAAVFGLATSAALVLNFVLARGVAIAVIGDEFVLHFPVGRKRIPLSGVTISATNHETRVPDYGQGGWFRSPAIFVHEVTIWRRGQPGLVVRTGLLREDSKVIAERMSAFARKPDPAPEDD